MRNNFAWTQGSTIKTCSLTKTVEMCWSSVSLQAYDITVVTAVRRGFSLKHDLQKPAFLPQNSVTIFKTNYTLSIAKKDAKACAQPKKIKLVVYVVQQISRRIDELLHNGSRKASSIHPVARIDLSLNNWNLALRILQIVSSLSYAHNNSGTIVRVVDKRTHANSFYFCNGPKHYNQTWFNWMPSGVTLATTTHFHLYFLLGLCCFCFR